MPNPEQPISEQIADIKEPSKQEPGLEIANTPELKGVVDIANTLAEKIQRDEDVTAGEVLDLEEALGQMKIDFGGEMMTLDEFKKIPNLKMRLEIIKEVIAGNFSRCSELAFLTNQAAESLSHHQGYLNLDGLISLSNKAAEFLSHHQGNLDLRGLTSLSNEAAESLSHHQGALYLDGLTFLSNEAAESLSRHQGYLNLPSDIRSQVNKFKQ